MYYQRLVERGLVYPCFCSRGQLHAASAPHRSDGQVVYPGTCRNLTARQVAEAAKRRPPAWRLRLPEDLTLSFTDGHMGPVTENLPADCGDFVLRRADGGVRLPAGRGGGRRADGGHPGGAGRRPALQHPPAALAVSAAGSARPDLLPPAAAAGPDGRRLSKRDGDQSLENLQARFTPEQIIGKLAYAAGLRPTPDPVRAADLVADFSWDKVPRQDICLPDGLF